MPTHVKRNLADESATLAFAARLAPLVAGGAVIYLTGDLGAGKTTFCRGLIRALGHKGAVKSPTFTLVEPYQLDGTQIFHFDLYRLNDPGELEYIGVDDYFDPRRLCLVEWPERGDGLLPECDIEVSLVPAGRGRTVTVTAQSDRGERIVQELEVG
ncbi:MAG: tRNA (adenosine(37)-N6)-threonylcarbamoyltransferase complex ATPase subunit type 1 TsaE [Pseudomonadales bacterium]|nr:tRNA (adenosine(37)-N6)-threonylcarbamoyltransferase complex ATPase subunit type 1 TsaE [Pseudomonadales bacterium]